MISGGASGLRLYALTCGWLTAPAKLFLATASGALRVPVPAYLIEHPRGAVLFDTGLNAAAGVDARGRLRELANLFTVELGAGEDVAGRLAQIGVDRDRVRYLINSHLHFDHCGANAAIPNARLIVQRREWEAGHHAEQIAANHYYPADYDLGHDVLAVDGEHDLFGDGRIVCIPTHGHTPGHQSVRLQLESGPVVLAADACYLRETLERLTLPAVVADGDAMLASLRRLRDLQRAGARIFYGHDPDFWSTVPQVPLPVL